MSYGHENGSTVEPFRLHFFLSVQYTCKAIGARNDCTKSEMRLQEAVNSFYQKFGQEMTVRSYDRKHNEGSFHCCMTSRNTCE